jgi:hypothetical protein
MGQHYMNGIAPATRSHCPRFVAGDGNFVVVERFTAMAVLMADAVLDFPSA